MINQEWKIQRHMQTWAQDREETLSNNQMVWNSSQNTYNKIVAMLRQSTQYQNRKKKKKKCCSPTSMCEGQYYNNTWKTPIWSPDFIKRVGLDPWNCLILFLCPFFKVKLLHMTGEWVVTCMCVRDIEYAIF